MENPHLVEMTTICEIYATGQKVVAVILEYNLPLAASSLSADCFTVEGQTVCSAWVSDSYRGTVQAEGCFVELTLDSANPNTDTKQTIGAGRHGRLMLKAPRQTVSQVKPLVTVNGQTIPPFDKMSTQQVNHGIADSFTIHTFQPAGSDRRLDYHLYSPKGCVAGQKYPLVLFMHDAGSCSDDPMAPLAQGSGGVVWARDAEAGKRPCFVVVPHYPQVCANDDYEVTWEAEATVHLLQSLLEQHPIDCTRLYGTGQSMGCMMLCEMLLQHPGFFAGSLLVAGQWNPIRMAAAREEALWAIVSSGDEKAYPIMGQCFSAMEKAGATVSRSPVDARADLSVINEVIGRQRACRCSLNFSWFEGNSILPLGAPNHPGMHHISTWGKAYEIDALREWLFEQRNCNPSTLKKEGI